VPFTEEEIATGWCDGRIMLPEEIELGRRIIGRYLTELEIATRNAAASSQQQQQPAASSSSSQPSAVSSSSRDRSSSNHQQQSSGKLSW
jgi:hypothetical protein